MSALATAVAWEIPALHFCRHNFIIQVNFFYRMVWFAQQEKPGAHGEETEGNVQDVQHTESIGNAQHLECVFGFNGSPPVRARPHRFDQGTFSRKVADVRV